PPSQLHHRGRRYPQDAYLHNACSPNAPLPLTGRSRAPSRAKDVSTRPVLLCGQTPGGPSRGMPVSPCYDRIIHNELVPLDGGVLASVSSSTRAPTSKNSVHPSSHHSLLSLSLSLSPSHAPSSRSLAVTPSSP
ncbi:unnamed protein product, partial [Ectocarpus fasciculatus]